MGFVHAQVEISNARFPERGGISTNVLVDSAAYLTCVPEQVRAELDLEEIDRRPVQLADGRITEVPYVGPIHLRFENRQAFGGALVMGNEVLLGAIAMEDMDFIIEPRSQKLVVNPERPDKAGGFMGSIRPA
jgi:clan AA aspartic protease